LFTFESWESKFSENQVILSSLKQIKHTSYLNIYDESKFCINISILFLFITSVKVLLISIYFLNKCHIFHIKLNLKKLWFIVQFSITLCKEPKIFFKFKINMNIFQILSLKLNFVGRKLEGGTLWLFCPVLAWTRCGHPTSTWLNSNISYNIKSISLRLL